MNPKNLFISFVLIALFSFAIISFGINIESVNHGNQTIMQDQRINNTYGNIVNSLQSAQKNATNQQSVYNQDNPVIASNNLVLTSIVSIWKVFTGSIIGFYNITIGLVFESLFGSTFSAIFAGLTTIFIVLLILMGWQLIRTGFSS